jgi:hypothetical protein
MHSIQDNLKKINSAISYTIIISLFVGLLGITCAIWYISNVKLKNVKGIVYTSSVTEQLSGSTIKAIEGVKDKAPFGSKSGKTYTFSWCQGSSRIKEVNKIYYTTEEEAKRSGRTLSKLCKR